MNLGVNLSSSQSPGPSQSFSKDVLSFFVAKRLVLEHPTIEVEGSGL